MKSPHDLVKDIYTLMETKEIPDTVDLRAECDRFGKVVAEMLWDNMQPEEDRSGRLRLSAIGHPNRKIYNAYKGIAGDPLKGSDYIKFLYGHFIEAMLIALTRISGHEVTEEQKEVSVEGIKGHQDCRIDGMLVDVKSCSSYGFKKFQKSTLHEDDPFGYIAQLKGYAYQEGDTEYAWLAMDKQNGTLAWLHYDELDKETHYHKAVNYSISDRVREVKKLVSSDSSPEKCYGPVQDGKSGNERLAQGCVFCAYKHECWPELRVFHYANGPRYLTKVDNTPRVVEVLDGF